MRLNSKQKIELAVILILFLVLFTIPMIAEIHYQTFYYLFVTTIFPLSMYFFNREVKMSDEALFQKMKRKKRKGLGTFLGHRMDSNHCDVISSLHFWKND